MKNPCTRAMRSISLAATLAILLTATGAPAASFTFDLGSTLTGTTPDGSSPFVTALFQDVSPGTVDLTIAAPGLAGGEYLSDLLLNLDSSLSPANLKFTAIAETGIFTTPSISRGENGFSGGGEDDFDLDLMFSSKTGQQFTAGDSLEYSITGITGITASDFNLVNCDTTPNSYLAVAQVGGIPCTSGSNGWIGAQGGGGNALVPEPGTVAFTPLALASLAAARRFRRPAP